MTSVKLTLALALAACFIACDGGRPAAGQPSAATLRVGVAPVSPPMVYKEGKEIVGAEADFAKTLGRELGRTVKFVELPFPDLIDALLENKIDIIMSSMSVTRARQARIAFSEPYLKVGQMALVRGSEKLRFFPLNNSLANATVGVKRATTADLLVQQEFPRAKRKYYDSGDEAAKALAKKKIDLYFTDSTLIWYLEGKYEAQGLISVPFAFSEEILAWGLRRSDRELLASVNKALKGMAASGELKRVLRQWIPKLE